MRPEIYRNGLHIDDQDFALDVMEPVLFRVLQGDRMNRIYIYRERHKRRFIIGIGSHDYGSQEVP